MAFCKNCGVEIEDGTELCSACAEATATEQVEVGVIDEVEPASKKLNVGSLVWSIINIIVCGGTNFISWGLGIAALVFTILGYTSTTAEAERKKLKLSKTFNLISTILAVVTVVALVVFYVIYFVLIFALAGSSGAY